jgi:uncharacterized protein YihD (DUF1040 family)
MGQVASIDVGLTADASQYVASMKQAGNATKGMRDEVNKTKETLKSIKEAVGEESAFGSAIKALKGAGAIGAIGFGVNFIGDMARSQVEFNDKLRAGELTSTQIKDHYVEMIPIVGTTVLALKEAATGQIAMEKAAKATRDALKESYDHTQHLGRELKNAGLSGVDQAVAARRLKADDDVKGINDKLAKDSVGKSYAQRKQLEEQANEEIAGIYKLSTADIAEIQRQANNEQLAREREHTGKLGDLSADARIRRLKEAGNADEAEIAAIDKDFNSRIRATKEGYQKLLDAEKSVYRKGELQRQRDEEVAALEAEKKASERTAEALQARATRRRELNRESETRQADFSAGGNDYLAAREAAIAEGANKYLDAQEKTGRIYSKEQEDIRQQTLRKLEILDEQYRAKKADADRAMVEKTEDLQADVRDRQLRRSGQSYQADKERIEREAQKAQDEILRGFKSTEGADRGQSFIVNDLGNTLAAIQANNDDAQEKIKDLVGQNAPLAQAMARRFDFTVPGTDFRGDPQKVMEAQLAQEKKAAAALAQILPLIKIMSDQAATVINF